MDFLCARVPGSKIVDGERWRSRQGVGSIETLLDMAPGAAAAGGVGHCQPLMWKQLSGNCRNTVRNGVRFPYLRHLNRRFGGHGNGNPGICNPLFARITITIEDKE